jgi:tetratricopeptide (TPR) repeat protein
MQGVKYFLVVVAGVAGLSVATRLAYSRHQQQTTSSEARAQRPETNAQATGQRPKAGNEASRQALAANETGRKAQSAERQAPTPYSTANQREPRVAVTAKPRAKPSPNGAIVRDSAAGFIELVKPPQVVIDANLPQMEDPPWQATPRQLARDSAYVMVSSGRLQAAITVLDAWMRSHPADAEIGLDLARLRARAQDWKGSIAQYDALIAQNRTAPLLFERGQTYLWAGDARRGEADLLASEKMSPSSATERQLGDHYRWQGNFAKSASWYRRAQRHEPADTAVRNSMRLLDRALDARLLMPGELAGSDFGSGVSAISDNAGFDLYALRMSQGFRLGAFTVATISGEVRSATQMSAGGESQLDAYGFDLGLSTRAGASKLSASVGMLDHGDASPIVRGALSADAFLGSARVKALVRRAPAYELLWAPRMLGVEGSPATALQAQGNVSLALGRSAELYAMGEMLGVSDDNTRTAAQVALRRRVAGPVSLSYATSYMKYDQQTTLYYSPARYMSQALGIEWARYRDQGLSFAARAMPGYAWIREPAGTSDSTSLDVTAFQFATGLEIGYRRGAWDWLLSTGLSSGREGGYRSQNALLYVRRSW